MATFEGLKSEGNEYFKKGQYKLALESYSKALQLSPSNHIVLSNCSLALYKLERYESALEEAEKCIVANNAWEKGYARKATALNALGRHDKAKEACITGFALQDQSLCKTFVDEWLRASRSLVSSKYDVLKKPPWSDVIPEAADLFCDDYCELLFTVTYARLSDAQGMSQDKMTQCVMGAVQIAEQVLAEFHHPPSPALREYAENTVIRFASRPASETEKLISDLKKKVDNLVVWLKNGVHKSLRQILDPILILILSSMLTRGNVLCQAYTGFNETEYLGYACIGFFEQKVLTDPVYTAFHMSVLSLILNSYRFRGALNESEVDLIRGLCHKLENLLPHLPKSHKNYDLIIEHYQHTVKVFREICAKVLTGFKRAHDPTEALSELEQAMLKCDEDPEMALNVTLKYLTDIGQKNEATKSSAISYINFIDAENMLYITGIMAKLDQHNEALRVFHSGESMALSLLATTMERNVLSFDELPASISNCRKLALSGAIWLKDHFPKEAADVFIRWKSMFTELRATLIRIGLRDCYKGAFQSLEKYASTREGDHQKPNVLSTFQTQEQSLLQKFSLPAIKVLYDQCYDSVAQALSSSDVVIDYTFKIYNPEHCNPPKSQACAVVIRSQKEPLIFSLSDSLIYELIQQWPKAIYKEWISKSGEFEDVTKALSNALFPDPIKKVLLDPSVHRIFICPDVDLMCFPIDQLPIQDDNGFTLPLFERMSVSILSSPRELIRDKAVHKLLEKPTQDLGSQEDPPKARVPSDTAEEVTCLAANLRLSESKPECFIIANPDFTHESENCSTSSWKGWFESLGEFIGLVEPPSDSHHICELKGTQNEAEAVYKCLCTNQDFNVHHPITQKDASISTLLSLQSPHVLHVATHGYTSKQESTPYRGDFWKDESSGLQLAGAQTFLDRKFEKIDPKAGTGHMNSIAMCGMQLEKTRLVFVSACDSSVGSRPAQEMPDSITQALRAAGAQTVISTLWAVQDNEATEFASHFYFYLVNHPGCRPSKALGQAKATMRRNGKSMFHWGAYICHGVDCTI